MRQPSLPPSRFYAEFLKAPLRNDRWSWGAVRPNSNQLFLRIWKDQIEETPSGSRVRVLRRSRKSSSPGQNERIQHIELLQSGYQGYGVVCLVRDPDEQPRKIHSFDREYVATFGPLIEEGDEVFATITGMIPIADVLVGNQAPDRTVQDIEEILSLPVGKTSKEVLAEARIGQGKFRNDVLTSWGMCCCVTGTQLLDVIRASHIKPWKDSTDDERLDPNNGLPLVANLDALFDAGLITFNVNGDLVISDRVPDSERTFFQLEGLRMQRAPSKEVCRYLEFHYEHVFMSSNHSVRRAANG